MICSPGTECGTGAGDARNSPSCHRMHGRRYSEYDQNTERGDSRDI